MMGRSEKWEKDIYLNTSTNDIVRMESSGDYVTHFIDDKTLNSYKMPEKKKIAKKSKEK